MFCLGKQEIYPRLPPLFFGILGSNRFYKGKRFKKNPKVVKIQTLTVPPLVFGISDSRGSYFLVSRLKRETREMSRATFQILSLSRATLSRVSHCQIVCFFFIIWIRFAENKRRDPLCTLQSRKIFRLRRAYTLIGLWNVLSHLSRATFQIERLSRTTVSRASWRGRGNYGLITCNLSFGQFGWPQNGTPHFFPRFMRRHPQRLRGGGPY